MLMKTTAKENGGETGMVSFRLGDDVKRVLDEWDKTGYGRSVFIKNLIVRYGDQTVKDLPPLLAQVGISRRRKVVRGKGIEPLTPTVSM